VGVFPLRELPDEELLDETAARGRIRGACRPAMVDRYGSRPETASERTSSTSRPDGDPQSCGIDLGALTVDVKKRPVRGDASDQVFAHEVEVHAG
jgi:hypothetical protein